MTLLRWGILGAARINRKVIPALTSSKRQCVHAIASRTLAKAQAEAEKYAIPHVRVYEGYERLLADPDIDIVYIPLPNSLHAEWTLKAIGAKKHVLCEKPMTISLKEADEIAAAAKEAGVIVCEALMYRYHPAIAAVRQLIRDNGIGRVRLIRGTFRLTLDRPGDARYDPSMGGGCLWDVGCYPVSYARFLLEKEPLDAFGWADIGPTGVDETFAGQLRFPDGEVLQFDCGFRAPYKTEMEIIGSTGTIRLPLPYRPGPTTTFELSRDQKDLERITVEGTLEPFETTENMADAVLGISLPKVSLADSRGNCAALVALLQSAKEGKPVIITD